jgi:hypothetical protein
MRGTVSVRGVRYPWTSEQRNTPDGPQTMVRFYDSFGNLVGSRMRPMEAKTIVQDFVDHLNEFFD